MPFAEPTLKELEETQQKLIAVINALEIELGANAESAELATIKVGLAQIEAKICELSRPRPSSN